MRKVISWLVAGALLAGCAAPKRVTEGAEEFDVFFARALLDRAYRQSRTSPDLRVIEEITWGNGEPEIRTIPCSPDEIEAHGWNLLPGVPTLRNTGTGYRPAVRLPDETMLVTLGPPDGGDDARYTFQTRNRAWFLTGVTILSEIEVNQLIPPPPCGDLGHRPDNSSKPTPLRGAA